jgi:hypothetical protein
MRERRVTARRLLIAIAVLGLLAVVILAFGFLGDSTALWAALLLRALLVWIFVKRQKSHAKIV